MRKWLQVILLLVFSIEMYSQANVSVGWSADTIDLGDEVELLLFVQIPAGTEVTEVSGGFLDSIISGFQTVRMRDADSTRSEDFEYADVEIVDYGQFSIDQDDGTFKGSELNWASTQNGGDVLLNNKFRMRVWDPGQIIATNPAVNYIFQGDTISSFRPFQAELIVRLPMDAEELQQDSFDIAPIKPIIEEPIEWKDFLPLIIAIGLGLLSFLAYFLYKRYKANQPEEPIEIIKEIIPAHVLALDKLEDLEGKKLWQSDIKGYQSELTYIIREYLENRYSFPALESTTDEIVSAIKEKDISSDLIHEMKNILQVADLVKFAKGTPSENIHQEFMEKAFAFVKSTQEIITIPEE